MRWLHKMLIGFAVLGVLVFLSGCIYLQQPQFGVYPEGERLQKVLRSPHYQDGEFRNTVNTPTFSEGTTMLSVMVGGLLDPGEDLRPTRPVPVTRTDLKALSVERDAVIWLGHSSFFVVIGGKRVLIDPVFSPFAAPVSFSNKAFDGTNLYTADDMPEIDLLLITHDHWDHLDHASVTALEGKVKRVMAPLGVGAHVEHWGYAQSKVHEADWYESLELEGGLVIHLVPARHFSGRWLTRNKSLWGGFVLETGTRRMLFSGDSGYGPHFRELAQRFGRFDLAALDMGQYDPRWPYIHMTPQEAAQAAVDLRTQTLLPAHIGRFSIARHAWYAPFERISAASEGLPSRLATPRIGEVLRLDEERPSFSPWWNDLKQVTAITHSTHSEN